MKLVKILENGPKAIKENINYYDKEEDEK